MTTPANQNDKPNHTSADRAWFCPACGSSDVTASALAGGHANCNTCTWTGSVEELPTFLFTHDMGTPEEVFRSFFIDTRKLLGQHFATQIGHMLIKWGFLEAPDGKNTARVVKLLSRYVGAITKAVVVAIVTERQAMEKEGFREQAKHE
jgi:hypothetical protein